MVSELVCIEIMMQIPTNNKFFHSLLQDCKQGSVSSVHNVDFVKDDTLEGENDKAAPEIEHVSFGISSNSYDGDMVRIRVLRDT